MEELKVQIESLQQSVEDLQARMQKLEQQSVAPEVPTATSLKNRPKDSFQQELQKRLENLKARNRELIENKLI